MDLTSPFKSEVLRPITTWVIPGSIAIGPYLLITAYYVPSVGNFLRTEPSAAAAVVAICVVAAGLILDNFGSSIEASWWDPLLVKRYPNHLSDWDRYLKLRIKDEIVAARYLRDHLLRMKFELSMAPALMLFWMGLLWLNYIYRIWFARGTVLISVILAIGDVYFLYSSFHSARVLSRVRASILEAVEEEAIIGKALTKEVDPPGVLSAS